MRFKKEEKHVSILAYRDYVRYFEKTYLDGRYEHEGDTYSLKEGRVEFEHSCDLKNEKNEEEVAKDNTLRENKYLHRISVVLNRAGQALFHGFLDINLVMPVSSVMILKDYRNCGKLLKEIKNNSKGKNYSRIYFKYISLVSLIYYITFFIDDFKEAKKYVLMYEDKKDIVRDERTMKEYLKNELLDIYKAINEGMFIIRNIKDGDINLLLKKFMGKKYVLKG